jgi:hypothetical protein
VGAGEAPQTTQVGEVVVLVERVVGERKQMNRPDAVMNKRRQSVPRAELMTPSSSHLVPHHVATVTKEREKSKMRQKRAAGT